MTDFQIGDKVAAAVNDWRKKAQLRIGVVEKIYGPTAVETSDRLVIRDESGDTHVVRAARSVVIPDAFKPAAKGYDDGYWDGYATGLSSAAQREGEEA